MKKTIAALAAVAAVSAIAAPAAAQSYDHGRHDRGYGQERHWNGGWNINQRQEQLDRMIDRGIRNGSLNGREARRLREEFRDIARLEARYRSGGLNNWERADLDRRFDRLEARVRHERQDRQYGARW